MIEPITPKQALIEKKMPDEVIEVFNELIKINFNGKTSKFLAKEAARLIASKMEISVDEVFNRKLLDVELVYQKKGWKVEYDQPGYNENYDAYFTFKASSPLKEVQGSISYD